MIAMVDVTEIDGDVIVAQHGPFVMTATSVVTTSEPTFEQWEAATRWVQKTEKSSPFWLGELLAFGEGQWGEKYAQAVETTGLSEGTLMNAAYVMKAIDPERRHEALSFAHHQEVASLPPAEQDAWLDKAESDGLSSKDLRHRIKVDKAQKSGQTVELWLTVKCSDVDDQQKLAEAMKAQGRVVELQTRKV